ncbi:hypothetical protein GLYMA_10G066750v4 [Glycine max]|nr:hypothetical protein GLYMA_10G066750v4 [Glycine max]KAH1137106.1 hypothetical protein GYH30_027191 [Glycine max]
MWKPIHSLYLLFQSCSICTNGAHNMIIRQEIICYSGGNFQCNHWLRNQAKHAQLKEQVGKPTE